MAFISGAFFSPHSFPEFLRAIADVLPLTYFIRLTRDVMLHGHQFWDNWARRRRDRGSGARSARSSRSGASAGNRPRVRTGRLRVTRREVLTVITKRRRGRRVSSGQLRRLRRPQRDAAEIDDLARTLLPELGRRDDRRRGAARADGQSETSVHQVRIELPDDADVDRVVDVAEDWAQARIDDRHADVVDGSLIAWNDARPRNKIRRRRVCSPHGAAGRDPLRAPALVRAAVRRARAARHPVRAAARGTARVRPGRARDARTRSSSTG